MNISRTIVHSTCIALLCMSALSARANSIGLVFEYFQADPGIVTLSVVYDFTEFPMFGGGANLIYDESALEFVSFEQSALPDDVQAPASPIGDLDSPGLYVGLGIGTFDFINGINSAGTIGTFQFNVIGNSPNFSSCGDSTGDFILTFACLTPNAINPMVSLAGENVTVPLFLAGDGTYVPIPGALWLFLGSVGALLGMRKRQA